MGLFKDLRQLTIDERAEFEKLKAEKAEAARQATLEKLRLEALEKKRLADPKASPLWQHQIDAIEKARNLNYFNLYFEIGTGKTRAAISILADKIMLHERVLRTLVLCPPVVIQNFKNEFTKYSTIDSDLVIPLVGTMKSRLKAFKKAVTDKKNFIIITNYEILYRDEILMQIKQWQPEVLICDEIHKCKDPTARRTKELIDLSDFFKYRYGLSGTPVLNSQMDLWAQNRIVEGGHTLGKNFYQFRARYFYDVMANKKGTQGYFPNYQPVPGVNKELFRLIEPFTARVKKEDVLKFLPPLVKKTFYVDMTPSQEIAYNSMKKDFIAFINSEACTAELAIVKALRLNQIVSGFAKLESGKEEVFAKCPRVEALTNILSDSKGAKVIVWCVYKKNYEMIREVCNVLKLEHCELFGETTDKATQVARFQDPSGPSVMIANQSAGGIGVNLTQSSIMVYYSKTWSLEQDLQSEGRNYRGGSEIHKSITRIDLITKGTIDEIITDALEKKKQIGDSIFDGKQILETLRRKL